MQSNLDLQTVRNNSERRETALHVEPVLTNCGVKSFTKGIPKNSETAHYLLSPEIRISDLDCHEA